MKDGSNCDACGSYGEGGVSFEGVKYREHLLCPHCIKVWQLHPDWDWESFKRGEPLSDMLRQERKAKVRLLTSQGKKVKEIARFLGVSANTVILDSQDKK